MAYGTIDTTPTRNYALSVQDVAAGLDGAVIISFAGSYTVRGEDDTPTETEAASTALFQKIVTALDGHADLVVTGADREHTATQTVTP